MIQYYIYPPLHGECFRVIPSVAFLVKFVQGYHQWPNSVDGYNHLTRLLHAPGDRDKLTWIDECCLGQ